MLSGGIESIDQWLEMGLEHKCGAFIYYGFEPIVPYLDRLHFRSVEKVHFQI